MHTGCRITQGLASRSRDPPGKKYIKLHSLNLSVRTGQEAMPKRNDCLPTPIFQVAMSIFGGPI